MRHTKFRMKNLARFMAIAANCVADNEPLPTVDRLARSMRVSFHTASAVRRHAVRAGKIKFNGAWRIVELSVTRNELDMIDG